MRCENCGKEMKSIGYNADCKRVCKQCFTKFYWDKVFNNPNTIIFKQKAYQFTDNPLAGGFGGIPFTITMSDGTIHKHVGLWANGTVPSDRNVKDNCVSIKEEK